MHLNTQPFKLVHQLLSNTSSFFGNTIGLCLEVALHERYIHFIHVCLTDSIKAFCGVSDV
jgi:hypothetical protein